jgi:uncharacterized protein
MDYNLYIAAQLNVKPEQVKSTIELLDEGNTLPFIARYRKEKTGGLDEEQIRNLSETLDFLRSMDERRHTILESIKEQGKLTPELEKAILDAATKTELEDIYQPYKPKRKTRASVAREKGLQGLADLILQQVLTKQTLEEIASPFITPDVPTTDDAFSGARDIVAETISDHAEVRGGIREKAMKWGTLYSAKDEDAVDEKAIYQVYYDFSCRVDLLRPYQVLAINRGESENILKVEVEVAERDWQGVVGQYFKADPKSILAEQMTLAIEDSAERLLLPAIERDVRRALTEKAELHAIQVFSTNLRGLLNQPPLAEQVIMGIDPGFRTGCKIAVIDATGKILETGTIYPHEPQNAWVQTLDTLEKMVKRHHITLLSIGNGTASRETEQLAAELIQRIPDLKYVIVNEAGASVYSASPLARSEMPDLDVSIRGAVSIARRLQDPLAELVKIDPKSIGVGLYQHDVDQSNLSEALNGVVESVVNNVGVDVNTASPSLLTYVAGIGPKLANAIVSYRDSTGPFKEKTELKKVSGLGPKAFEQAAGFLRIRDGKNPLDASAIHPESYPIAEAILEKVKIGMDMPVEKRKEALENLQKKQPIKDLAESLGTGIPTLKDIFDQLIRPGRDPRQDLPAPILRSDVLKMEDLVTGMCLKGTVRNVVDFGAFVDIGVKQDGLLHRSQIPQGAVLNVGDVISVEIIKVETDRGRIALGWAK